MEIIEGKLVMQQSSFDDERITYFILEKPIQKNYEIIYNDVDVTSAFIDSHSHIGMV